MAIVLGNYTFDDARTAVKEAYEEVGGRDARVVVLKGIIARKASADLVEAELDAMLAQASEDPATELSLRTGRRLFVRRRKFLREIARAALTGSFTLELEAADPCETASSETSVAWAIAASGAQKALATTGNAPAQPTITLVASGTVIAPVFSDGERSIALGGTVEDGKTLVIDGSARAVTLEGVDVTPYTTGLFPEIAAGGTAFTYTDDASSSHTASVTVAYHDRWW